VSVPAPGPADGLLADGGDALGGGSHEVAPPTSRAASPCVAGRPCAGTGRTPLETPKHILDRFRALREQAED